MRVGRLRTGELLVLLGLLGLVATLFLDWFSVDPQARCTAGEHAVRGAACTTLLHTTAPATIGSGWGALGHPWLEFLAVFAAGLLAVLLLTLRAGPGRSTYGVVVGIVLTGALGFVTLLLTVIRVLIARPDARLPAFADSPSLAVGAGLDVGAWIGLAALLVALCGLWIAMSDDRPDAPDSRYDPPEARPLPQLGPDGRDATSDQG